MNVNVKIRSLKRQIIILIKILLFIFVFLFSFRNFYIKKLGFVNLYQFHYQSFINEILIILLIYSLIAIIFAISVLVFSNSLINQISFYSVYLEWEFKRMRRSLIMDTTKIILIFFILLTGFQLYVISKELRLIVDFKKLGNIYKEYQFLDDIPEELKKIRLIAHAGGGIDGLSNTNSLEALKLNYNLGHRIFEMDLILMPDGDILCAHDINFLNKITGINSNLNNSMEYKKKKIYGKYSVINLKELFIFMAEHRDMYLVTDSKDREHSIGFISNDEYNNKFWDKFVKMALSIDKEILERVIPQIYYPEMLKILDEKYKFRTIIFTLYATAIPYESILQFVFENPRIKIITLPPSRLNEVFLLQGLKKLNRYIFTHTFNDLKEMYSLINQKGIYGFYTDFITPQQFLRKEK